MLSLKKLTPSFFLPLPFGGMQEQCTIQSLHASYRVPNLTSALSMVYTLPHREFFRMLIQFLSNHYQTTLFAFLDFILFLSLFLFIYFLLGVQVPAVSSIRSLGFVIFDMALVSLDLDHTSLLLDFFLQTLLFLGGFMRGHQVLFCSPSPCLLAVFSLSIHPCLFIHVYGYMIF